jgi:serine phosphatase RsbU (regulator of sigma subunit)
LITARHAPRAQARKLEAARVGPDERGGWLEQTLSGVLGQVRKLVEVDGAAFLLVDGDHERIEPASVWYASEEVQAALEPMLTRPYDSERPGIVEVAVDRGRALLLPRIEDWEASEELRQQAELTLGKLRAEGAWAVFRGSSMIACPVRTAFGETLGALIAVSVRRRPLGRGDLERVEVLADMAALALERSERLDAEARRAHEELLLKRAAQEVSGSLEHEEVYARIVEQAVRLTGASRALLTRLQPAGGELAFAAGVGLPEELAALRHPLEGSPIGEVARTRTPYRSRGSESGEPWHAGEGGERSRSLMHVPIDLGPRLFGVLSVGHQEPDRFTRDDLDVLVKHARSSAAAIANSMDFEHERHLARALTMGFVPESLPTLPGYEVGLVYEPAAEQPTGGDVYGAWQLPSGDIGILVGDVSGKGAATAGLSSMTRFFIEARSWDDESSPSRVLDQANTLLRNRLPSDTFVTAFFGLLSPEGLRYANAGHLSPLVASADGAVSELGGRGLPLGIDGFPSYEEGELALSPGDLLLGFTDGVVEARRSGELYGSERLAETLATLVAESPEGVVRRVHETVRDWADGLTDDTAVLAVRRSDGARTS